jgi:hypothetical protein
MLVLQGEQTSSATTDKSRALARVGITKMDGRMIPEIVNTTL